MLDNNYAEKARNCEESNVWFIPHYHGVYHPLKPKKIRVVFDCSARFRGVLLSDNLLQGPDLTNSLLGVLRRFRLEPIAIMGDIQSMFHQVELLEKNRDLMRFLWWKDGDLNELPQEYRMKVQYLVLFAHQVAQILPYAKLLKIMNLNTQLGLQKQFLIIFT